MKRFCKVALAAVMATAAVAVPMNIVSKPEAEVVASANFDENNIALSFGAISDVHIQKNSYAVTSGDYCKPLFRQALDSLITQASVHDKDGLDAVVVAGDLIEVGVGSDNQPGRNTRSAAELNAFADVIYEYKDTSIGTNFITTPGNHDWRGEYTRDLVSHRYLFGEEYFTSNDTRKEYRFDEKASYRHTAIVKNGQEFHFIVLQPEHGTTPYAYNPVALDYLEADLKDITTKNPNAYVYVATHVAPIDTARGSEYDWRDSKGFLSEGLMVDVEDSRYADKYATRYTYTDFEGNQKSIKVDKNGNTIRKILPKYPQVMSFAGHTHCPLNEERSIWQDTFTALSTSSSKYTSDFPDSDHVNNTINTTTGNERNRGGLLVQVDVNGNVRITRVNFSRNYLVDKTNLVIKDAWELEAPKADKSHLVKYSKATRVANNEAPTMSGEITLTLGEYKNLAQSDDTETYNVKLSVPAAKDDDYNLVAYYNIKVYKAGTSTLVKSYKIRSDLLFCDVNKNENTQRANFEFFLKLSTGNYDIKVQAVDSWEAASNWITYSNYTVA